MGTKIFVPYKKFFLPLLKGEISFFFLKGDRKKMNEISLVLIGTGIVMTAIGTVGLCYLYLRRRKKLEGEKKMERVEESVSLTGNARADRKLQESANPEKVMEKVEEIFKNLLSLLKNLK